MSEPDELAALLAPHTEFAVSPVRREEWLTASTRVLHRRLLFRRLSFTLGAILVFVLGGAGGWLVKPLPILPEPLAAAPEPTVAPPAAPSAAVLPGDLEVKAELSDDRAEVARLYREAGDKYLVEFRNYEQAARCYRLHLDASGEADRKVAATDSWLLMSMKSSTRKENADENSGS